MKETFKVAITKECSWYVVDVTSNKTGRHKYDICSLFPKACAKRLKREIKKEYKQEKYKKVYEI